MAREKYGYNSLSVGNKVVLSYYFTENDGWRFMRRGPETEIYIQVEKEIPIKDLEKILEEKSVVLKTLRDIAQEGIIKPGDYWGMA